MKAPAFWWRSELGFPARLLAPIGAIYGNVTARRMGQKGVDAAIPVICVGNLVAGGAGKTPTALVIAAMLQAMGRRPAFLSRGYGGELAGPISVDAARHTARQVGDEPLLLVRQGPTIVSRDRVAGAALAAHLSADVLVMDDGLQNPSLQKKFVLAVVDGDAGIGNGLCVPAGPLRAPLSAQWPYLDAVLIIGPGDAGDRLAHRAVETGKPVLRARLTPDEIVSSRLRGQQVLAFAGIGRPEKFFTSLRELGAEPVATHAFPDHALLTATEAAELLREARDRRLMLATTEKDFVRMRGHPDLAELANASTALPVKLQLEDEHGLAQLLSVSLAR